MQKREGVADMAGDSSILLDYHGLTNGTTYNNGLSLNTIDYHTPTEEDDNIVSSKYTLVETIIIVFFLGVIIFFSVTGNLLVCVAVLTDRNLRKTSNFFIISLAVADMLVAILVMSFAVANDIVGYWIFDVNFCSVWISFDIMCSTASILNLCAISLDRYVHIRNPFQYDSWVTPFRTCLAIFFVWLLSGFISFVPIQLGWHKWGLDTGVSNSTYTISSFNESTVESIFETLDPAVAAATSEEVGGASVSAAGEGSGVLVLREPNGKSTDTSAEHYYCVMELNPIYAVISSMISFFLPCLVMISIYVQLYVYARKQMASIKRMQVPTLNHSPDHQPHKVGTSQSKISDHKAAITLGIIMGVFLFCWTPFFTINIIGAFCPSCIPGVVFSIFTWLGYFNSTLNPVIYSIFNSEFRHAFKRVLGYAPCFRCQHKDDYRRSIRTDNHGAYGTVSEKTPMNTENHRTQLTQV